MSKAAFDKIAEGLTEALAIARGAPAMSEMVDRVRDAIAKALDPLIEPGRTTTLNELAAGCAVAAIEAHKAALAEAGFVIVPREPTEAMLAAVIPFPEHLRHEHAPDSPWHALMAAATIAERMAFRGRWQRGIDAALVSERGAEE